ncbi:hypothetical protein [Mameliella sediminis]|uniref:hypothetical protein n=1 Tax=Mameliella sediminis TaxID=2836866 RepID=UPI001C43F9E5|nr:hypothetical protein [Mameliella sediminis]MBV7393959.1 hypothetical protein [Mameliella sediminis]
MRDRLAACLAALCLLAPALPAQADPRLDLDSVQTCLDTALELGKKPTGCVDAAHAPCLQISPETPAVAGLCFSDARQEWSDAIGTRMSELSANAPERIAALAGIEVKYDLLSSLVQCDRMEELALLRELPAAEIQLQKARCTATASGLAYIRLLWRLPDPEAE